MLLFLTILFLLNSTPPPSEAEEVATIIILLLIPIVVAFAFFVFIFYRSRREAIVKRSLAELEMKALRAQMNPHFMFNCLNSIRNYIDAHKPDLASDYLVRFSRLMRMVLENSNYKEVSLQKDITSLELYIQMEQMRYGDQFDYKIEIDKAVDSENIAIPPLILQPYVENAILHGLTNRESKGLLRIDIIREGDYMKYSITDNGKKANVEITKPVMNGLNKKSMGSELTSERIALLNRSRNLKGFVRNTDLTNEHNEYAGRRVELLLPFEELN